VSSYLVALVHWMSIQNFVNSYNLPLYFKAFLCALVTYFNNFLSGDKVTFRRRLKDCHHSKIDFKNLGKVLGLMITLLAVILQLTY